MDVLEQIQQRIDGQRKWLLETAPECVTEQKHLNEGSQERVYWHYGYQVALADVLKLLQSPTGPVN